MPRITTVAGLAPRRAHLNFACSLLLRSAATAMALAGVTAAATPALAATAPAADTAPAAAAPTVDTGEIIVTALKRSESSLKVAATLQVLGGADLKTVGVTSVADVQNVVPGLAVGTGSFGTVVAIRGVTSTDQTSKGELGIAFNIDGAFVGRGQEEGVAFFNLERVEVLKGPQGTLYGRSSTGGAINLITKKPVIGEWSGYARVELGNYATSRAEAALNIPVNDMLALRIAGNVNNRDGFLVPTNATVSGSTTSSVPGAVNLLATGEPAKDDQKDRTGRFSLVFKPSADVTFTSINTVGWIGGVGASSAVNANLDKGGDAALQVYANPTPNFVSINYNSFNQQLNWKFGPTQLDLLGNEQYFDDHSSLGGNGNPFNTGSATASPSFGFDDYNGRFNTKQFEARLSNTDTGVFDYVLGANYYKEHIHESDHNWKAPLNADGSLSPSTSWSTAIDPLNDTRHESYGFFGQGTFHVTRQLGLVAGARYSHDHTSRAGTFALGTSAAACTYPNDCTTDPAGTISPNNGDETDSKVTWKLGVNFQATPADLFYATVSTGFKAGGFNDFDPTTHTTGAYGPESLTAYEIGYKGRPLPKLTVSASGYYYDYSKDQINALALFPTSAGVVGVLYTQLVPVEIYGAETELRYAVTPQTQLGATLAYEHSKIINYNAGFLGNLIGVFHNFAGSPLPNTPEFTATFSATHRIDLPGDAQLRLRAQTKVSDGYTLDDFANDVVFRQGAYTRTNASVTYATAGDRVTVQLFVENIENKVQRTAGPNNYNGGYGAFSGTVPSAETAGTAYPVGSLGFGVSTPRFFGVRLGTRF